MSYQWHAKWQDSHYWYLTDPLTNWYAAKLYYMHGRWNISIRDKANEAQVRKLCEAKMVELVSNKLEGT